MVERLFDHKLGKSTHAQIVDAEEFISHPRLRRVMSSPNMSILEKRIVLEHAASQHQTDLAIETNPTVANIARGVRIIKWGGPIDTRLPSESQHEYRIDEVGANYDESAYAYSLQQYFSTENQIKFLAETSAKALETSRLFSHVTKPILLRALAQFKKGQILDYGIKHFIRPHRYYDVFLSMKGHDQTMITVYIPIGESQLDPFVKSDRDVLDKKIKGVLTSAVQYVSVYSGKKDGSDGANISKNPLP